MEILNFAVTIGCFFLLLVSLHLFFAKQGNQVLNWLLAVLLFGRFGQLLVFRVINSDWSAHFPFFLQAFTPFYFAAPACFYLYLRNFIDGRGSFGRMDALHFIPAILAVIHVIPWPFSPSVNWDIIANQILQNRQLYLSEQSGLFPAYFIFLLRPALMIGYLIAAWHKMLKFSIVVKRNYRDTRTRWILLVLFAGTFFQLASVIPVILWSLGRPVVSTSYIVFICLMLLGILVAILHRPKIFYGYLFVAVDFKATDPAVDSETALPPKKPKLLPDQVLEHKESMEFFMESESPYLLPDFQIGDLAAKLDIPVHHCSFVINNLIGKNFRDWINGYRIRYFISQHLLKAHRMTIEALAYESGFKSLSTFYNAFKKETGLMPTVFFLQKEVLVA